jgi:hypothetical protein
MHSLITTTCSEDNYRQAGNALGLDLVGKPDLVSTDPDTPSSRSRRPSGSGWRRSRRSRRATPS